MIVVDKQLQCVNHTHVVLPTKTMNGKRIIPMTDGVYESFQRIIKNRYLKGDIEPVCFDEQGNAYEGFVFLATRSRRTIVRGHVEEYLRNCIKRFTPTGQLTFTNARRRNTKGIFSSTPIPATADMLFRMIMTRFACSKSCAEIPQLSLLRTLKKSSSHTITSAMWRASMH